ncbi:TRAP transporter substrate-binding protein [Stappia stellulata]|uniref:TRAP transporter substrate-binding protein n=1 Tax=Stappia stellulata TaxID=71235 RepID=UPI001CD7387F|nr:TRAP transporter substrate-binding protein [Stappia stellulata]MCA1242509.1 TRAP transporter substrate-binding protein [Stappia stellulata]
MTTHGAKPPRRPAGDGGSGRRSHGGGSSSACVSGRVDAGSSGAISRRAALGLAGAAAASGLAAPALAQTTIEWKMATAWPADLEGPGQSAQRICDAIALLSGGRMRVRLFPDGELVPATGIFDTVSAGTAQMGHAASAYWQAKMPAAVFFTAVPFGFLPHEHVTWIEQAGGQALWDKLYAPYGVRPFLAGNTGAQMGGWFTRPVETLQDLNGLKIRMPGLGGEIMRRLGATPVSLPPGELVQALSSGLIDAAEFLGPASDRALGFAGVSKLYYAPGFHDPNGANEMLVNSVAFDGLAEDLKAVVIAACRAETLLSMAESDWRNAQAFEALKTEDGVEVRAYPPEILAALRNTGVQVVASFADAGGLDRDIYKNYMRTLQTLAPWSSASTRLFLQGREI